MFISIIIPTLRESENLQKLIPEVSFAMDSILKRKEYEIIIVDDNSQDGTEEIISKLNKTFPVRLILRKNEKGLSSAVLRGFSEAKGLCFIVMDADLSHPPSLLTDIVKGLKENNDIVLPSRYIKGGGVEKWPLFRRLISILATIPARLLVNVSDPMSGFFAIKRHVIENSSLTPIGYKILLEILVKGKYDKNKVLEIPYIFRNRHLGASKLDSKVSKEYIKHLLDLFLYKLKIKGR